MKSIVSSLLIVTLCLSTGCTQQLGMRNMFKESFASLKPDGKADYDDGTDDAEEEWIEEAGVEARGDRPMEKDNDPFRDLLMSPKARSIERNLGIE
ncbi:hypothetical protein [Rubinisphaera margarita]|uniref:hypothetical protein n=1 Tax=Rubinisphaera margarita TaxID=2909586 RepID=UPI001EE87D8C|nr:hypothetical protein [Rubinisphaera margarita]MCG6156751.1 hypothetical protein [Rubinisphaera margarita]